VPPFPLVLGLQAPVDNTEPCMVYDFEYSYIPKIQFNLEITNIEAFTEIANNKIEYCILQ
jgi:hypothetical protein